MTANRNTRPRGPSSSSSTSGYNDDMDAITPCPSPEPEEHAAAPYNPEGANSNSQSSQYRGVYADSRPYSRDGLQSHASGSCRVSAERRRSSLVLGSGRTQRDAERLWARMLELQQKYGCYNSARMQAALEDGDSTVPSMACLELINDGVTMMPEEAEQLWNHWMALDSGLLTPAKPGKRRIWKRR